MIYLYSDLISSMGGIETYLHALSLKLEEDEIPFRVAVAERGHCSLLDELEDRGIDVHRQGWVPGDRWYMRQRVLLWWLWWHLEPGDWLYCLRQPHPELFLKTVRTVHSKGAKIAASWRLAPELMKAPTDEQEESYSQAVEETDAVISVSECTVHQFRARYDYNGPVHVVRYHNLPFFDEPVSLPEGPPWRIGYMGRIDIEQKNLEILFRGFRDLSKQEDDVVELHLYGGGDDKKEAEEIVRELGISDQVIFHGEYDHRTDLQDIVENSHFFVYTSRFEGGPCFTLLELMQAGRYVVASSVGGIPDLYDGHSEAGLLIQRHDDPHVVQNALRTALDRVKKREINGTEIRDRYLSAFDMETAHAEWKRALQIGNEQ